MCVKTSNLKKFRIEKNVVGHDCHLKANVDVDLSLMFCLVVLCYKQYLMVFSSIYYSHVAMLHGITYLQYIHLNDKITIHPTLTVFLNLSKAFDTIDHNMLLYKYFFFGIRGISYKWFASYLSNRKQYTEIHKCKSSKKNITSEQILFLIYINDIINSTSLNLLSFAEDNCIQIRSSGQYFNLQHKPII